MPTKQRLVTKRNVIEFFEMILNVQVKLLSVSNSGSDSLIHSLFAMHNLSMTL